MAHISQMQLKAGLSLHCVTNRGLPFLFETVATKTARHKGRWMINHFGKRLPGIWIAGMQGSSKFWQTHSLN